MSLRSSRVRAMLESYQRRHRGGGHFADWRSRLVREFRHWAVIRNRFPYDRVAARHHLLIPKRMFPDARAMNGRERRELETVRSWATERYDGMLENFPRFRSVRDHFHYHLLVFRSGSR